MLAAGRRQGHRALRVHQHQRPAAQAVAPPGAAPRRVRRGGAAAFAVESNLKASNGACAASRRLSSSRSQPRSSRHQWLRPRRRSPISADRHRRAVARDVGAVSRRPRRARGRARGGGRSERRARSARSLRGRAARRCRRRRPGCRRGRAAPGRRARRPRRGRRSRTGAHAPGSAAPATSTSSVRPLPPSPGRLEVDELGRFVQRHRADRYVAQARPGLDVELLGERRAAQVGLRRQHPRAHPRRRREMTGDRCLPVPRALLVLCDRCIYCVSCVISV
jgi:hypothetical protein